MRRLRASGQPNLTTEYVTSLRYAELQQSLRCSLLVTGQKKLFRFYAVQIRKAATNNNTNVPWRTLKLFAIVNPHGIGEQTTLEPVTRDICYLTGERYLDKIGAIYTQSTMSELAYHLRGCMFDHPEESGIRLAGVEL